MQKTGLNLNTYAKTVKTNIATKTRHSKTRYYEVNVKADTQNAWIQAWEEQQT